MSTNDGIPIPACAIKYTCLDEVYAIVIQAGRGCTLIKKILKMLFGISL
jgi:hypothetical protein